MVRLLKVAPFEEFEIALKKMSKFQLNTLANLAIDKEIADYDKTDLIKKLAVLIFVKVLKFVEWRSRILLKPQRIKEVFL